jgi:hypothetical protein
MEIWAGVAASLLGVIVGGLLQHLTAQRGLDRQHDWERARIVHDKLELIAEAADDLGRKMSKFYQGGIIAVESGEKYKPDGGAFPLARMEMLINFYAPELRAQFQRVVAVRDRMGETIGELVVGRVPRAKSDKQTMNGLLLKASFEVSSICEGIAKGASELARKRLKLDAEPSDALDARKEARK